MNGLEKAIASLGTAAELARRLGIAPQAVYQWERIPGKRVIETERLTGVPRQELRPDLHPPQARKFRVRKTATI